MKFSTISAVLVLGAYSFTLGLCAVLRNKVVERTEPADLYSVPSYSSKIRQTYSLAASGAKNVDSSDLPAVASVKAAALKSKKIFKRASRWTPKEVERLLKLKAEGMKFTEMEEHFPGRTWKALPAKYYHLTHDPPGKEGRKGRPWTDQENKLLLKLADGNGSWKEIAERFPTRTVAAVTSHYKYLRKDNAAPQRISMKYTAEEDERLIEALKSGKTVEEVSQSLEREVSSVKARVKILKRQGRLDPALRTMAERYYTDADYALMHGMRERNMSWEDIAARYFPKRSSVALRDAYRRHLQRERTGQGEN